jgi:hypothetical protein
MIKNRFLHKNLFLKKKEEKYLLLLSIDHLIHQKNKKMNEEIKKKLEEAISSVKKIENLGSKVTAGRSVPTPSNSLKPKIVIIAKPEDKK